MTDRNMEDIEKLFREGLNPETDFIAYQEGDWRKLNERLDRNEKKKKGIFWLTRLSGVAALLLLFFAIRMLWPEEQKQIIQQAEVQQKVLREKKEPGKPQASPEDQNTAVKTKPNYIASLSPDKLPKEKSLTKTLTGSKSEKVIPKPDSVQVENSNAHQELMAPIDDKNKNNSLQADTVKSSDRKSSTADESLFAAGEKPGIQPKPERQARKFALSLVAAPDYNGVDNLNNAKMGNDLGLMLTYEIAKSWSISTGGVYAKKLYDAGYSSYQPAKDIWTEYYPKSVNADCRVLDIPVNVSYTFLNRNKTKILIGTGISSYIMLREDYHFNYDETDSNTPLNFRVVNENQHWLSVVNIQATFERQLSSRLSISLQPFMKIPLKDIGFAGVKLQTLGMAVNLNWNFNL